MQRRQELNDVNVPVQDAKAWSQLQPSWYEAGHDAPSVCVIEGECQFLPSPSILTLSLAKC